MLPELPKVRPRANRLAPRRQIASCAAVLVAGVAVMACFSDPAVCSPGSRAASSAAPRTGDGMEDELHDLTSETVTEAVLGQIATTPDARMREVLSAAV